MTATAQSLVCTFVAGIGVAAILFCYALARTAASREEPSFIPAVAIGAFIFLCILVIALIGLAA